MFLLVDDSSSMVPWWPNTLDAFQMFLTAPATNGLGVGLQFFGTSCDVDGYAKSRVPIAPLPDSADALRQAFPVLPLEDTATQPALTGAIAYARSWMTEHKDHEVVVVLMTDGIPEECNSTIDNVADAARQGFEGQPSIRTHVILVGALGLLNDLARVGGTGNAQIVSPGSTSELVQALLSIPETTSVCTFEPPAPNGTAQLSVVVDHGDPNPTSVANVVDIADCDPDRGGWYYDSSAPTALIACSATCRALDGGGMLKGSFDCR